MNKHSTIFTILIVCCAFVLPIKADIGESEVLEVPKIDGYAQFRLNYLKSDDDIDDYDIWFQVSKGRLGVKGTMYDKLVSYRILMEFFGTSKTSDATSHKLLDYYIVLNLMRFAQVKVGQFKVPFTRQYYQSAAMHAFTDYALPIKYLKDGRDIGVEIFYKNIQEGILEYHLGVFNGNGSNKKNNDNTDIEVAGRIDIKWNKFNPYQEGFWGTEPGFAIGVSGYTNHLGISETSQERMGMGIDVTARLKGIFLAGEYTDVTTSVGDNEINKGGFYVQAGYMVIPKTLEVIGRYAQFDPDSEVENDVLTEISGGLILYHSGHRHKLTLNGARVTQETGLDDINSVSTTIQYQFNFK